MKTSATYNGQTTLISDVLFEPSEVITNPPRKSNKFPSPSLYYEGRYYFMEDLAPSQEKGKSVKYRCNLTLNTVNDQPYQIEVVYYSRDYQKWIQDTHYLTEELKQLLEQYQ